MCATCGCGNESGTRMTLLGAPAMPSDREHEHRDHDHPHSDHDHGDHDHGDHHHHDDHHRHSERALGPGPTGADRTVVLEQQILAKNASLADGNRHWLAERGVLAINLMSSPGSGKTTLLERTIAAMRGG